MKPSRAYDLYAQLESIRQRVNSHHYVTAEAREEQAGLEAELYAEEERLLDDSGCAEAACVTC